jgi:hypothetical protein
MGSSMLDPYEEKDGLLLGRWALRKLQVALVEMIDS